MGWGHASTEFFLLCKPFLRYRKTTSTDSYMTAGRPVSQYGLLWEACTHSFPYLSNRLAQISTVVEVPENGPGWIPFSIPIIIKQLVGEALTYVRPCYPESLLAKD